MKMKLVAVSVLGLMMTAPFVQAANISLTTEDDKSSYAIGHDLGQNIKRKNITIVVPALAQGITDAISGAPSLMTDEEMKTTLETFQKNMMAKATAQYELLSKENNIKGQTFLQENKGKPGVVTLADGLQYKIITAGKGRKPAATDTVTVEYSGHLLDGTEFDSTLKSGRPATFQLNQVIPGWTEALQLMPEGSTWELYIPAALAYGPKAVGDVIAPNSTLIFTVTLKSIEKTADKKKK